MSNSNNNAPKPPKPPNPHRSPNLDANAAAARAAHWLGLPHKSTYCDQYVEESILGHGGVYDDASQFYKSALGKNWIKTSAPPAGVPVFYAGNASSGHGHVAVSAGGGYVYSTDAQGNRIGKVRYDKLWGGTGSGQYLGWTGNIQTSKNGRWAHIGYDPSTVGKAPKVDVPKNVIESTSGSTPKPTPTPVADISPAPSDGISGTVNLTALQPGISKQFSGVTVGGNIPKVG